MHPIARATAALLVTVATLGGCASNARSPGSHPVPPTSASPPATPAALAAWEPIGRSVSGRPIEALTLAVPGPRILIIGGIHGDEPEAQSAIDSLAGHIAAARPQATVRIVRDANPDGTASRTRANSRGIDLNRNWPARNFTPAPDRGPTPLSEPETRALHRELTRFDPDVVLVCHSSPRGPFVNFDGPGAELAVAFAAAALRADSRWRVVPDMGYPTPGSLGSYVGVDRAVPILTIEFARGGQPGATDAALRDGVSAVLHECATRLAK
jgi:predicted deacylase